MTTAVCSVIDSGWGFRASCSHKQRARAAMTVRAAVKIPVSELKSPMPSSVCWLIPCIILLFADRSPNQVFARKSAWWAQPNGVCTNYCRLWRSPYTLGCIDRVQLCKIFRVGSIDICGSACTLAISYIWGGASSSKSLFISEQSFK